MSEPLLSVRGLSCERGGRILFSNLNFDLHSGQPLQVGGANGSGKTTLLRTISGLFSGYTGELRWRDGSQERGNALAVAADQAVARGSGADRPVRHYIGHRIGINGVLTPMENLRWSVALHRDPVADEIILDALAQVGLAGFEDSACSALSAGQRQRVALARLLLCPALLWVLDEPFAALDSGGVRWLEGLLARHAGAGGCVVVTSHHALAVPGLAALNLGSA